MTFKTKITDLFMRPIKIYQYWRDLKRIAKRNNHLGKEMNKLIQSQGELTDTQRLHYTYLFADLQKELIEIEIEFRRDPNG